MCLDWSTVNTFIFERLFFNPILCHSNVWKLWIFLLKHCVGVSTNISVAIFNMLANCISFHNNTYIVKIFCYCCNTVTIFVLMMLYFYVGLQSNSSEGDNISSASLQNKKFESAFILLDWQFKKIGDTLEILREIHLIKGNSKI